MNTLFIITAGSGLVLAGIYILEGISIALQRRFHRARGTESRDALGTLLRANNCIAPERLFKTICAGCNRDISAGEKCTCEGKPLVLQTTRNV